MKMPKIKVLIVEDEIILLKNMQKKITSVSPYFEVVGEAFDGCSALEIIQHVHPDIVFTDIRMPIMDGLELSKILNEKYPEIFTVIVSGYDDFEYARTALRYRVSNYLLKPLQYDALETSLFSLQKLIEERQKERISHVLRTELNGLMQSDFDKDEIANLKTCTFSLFLICFGNLHIRHKVSMNKSKNQKLFENLSWDFILKDIPFTFSEFWSFPLESDNIKLLLIETSSAASQDMAIFIHKALTKHFPQTTINLSYDKKTVAYSQLISTVKALQKTLFSSLVIGHSSVFPIAECTDKIPPAVLPTTSIQYLQALISSNNSTEFEKFLRHLFHEWEEKNYSQQWIDKVVMQILNMLQQNLIFSEETYGQMHQSIFTILETDTSLSSAKEKIISELLYWTFLNNITPSEIENVIEELDTYIRSHYTEEINLANLADKYHFNHSYLTRIFKKLKGDSPLKLINTLRINDAKELLQNPNLSVKEISEMLGFSSQHYFSRIFKEFTNQTPKEYRSIQS